jgi:hypothetical protein
MIHKDSVVEDTIIGNNVEFSGMIKTAEKASMKIKNKVVDAEYFGAVIGDNAKLKNVLIQPGTFVWPSVNKTKKELKGIVKR